jgi:hypothetical protein
MARNFHIRGHKGRKPNQRIYNPDTPIDVINSLFPESLDLGALDTSFQVVRPYYPFPKRKPDAVFSSHYVQHRQQDRGRAIALNLDPQHRFIKRVSNIWYFQTYEEQRKGRDVNYDLITFFWDGVGNPGDINYNTGYTQQSGYPHSYQWAAWFMVNGTSHGVWPPLPSVNPGWHFAGIPDWYEYLE